MDTQSIISIILLSVVLFLIVLTFLFFIEHKKERQKVELRNYQSSREGIFLKRYIPKSLESKYQLIDKQQISLTRKPFMNAIWYSFMVAASIILIIVFILVARIIFTQSLQGLFNA